MTSKNVKVFVFSSAIALLAAGCNSAAQPQANSQTGAQSAPMSSSSTMSNMPGMDGHGMASSSRSGFGMPNMPVGSKPFFGSIASVSGSQITISGHSRNSSSTVTTIVDITSSTQFQGGAQTDLAVGARVAGYGTANSDGSINAINLQINPSFGGRGQGGGHYQGSGAGQPQSQQ